MANKISMKETEIIHHVVKGIENFNIKTQMITARFDKLKDLLSTMKLVSLECDVKLPHQNKNTPKKVPVSESSTPIASSTPRAREVTCFKCRKPGHIARQCPSRNTSAASPPAPPNRSNVNTVSPTESLFRRQALLEGRPVLVLLDTGTKCNLIRQTLANNLSKETVATNIVLSGLNHTEVICNKKINVLVEIDDSQYNIDAK